MTDSRVRGSGAAEPDDQGNRTQEASGRETRPIAELFSKLASDVSLLISQEVALAKKELGQTFSQVIGGAVWLVIGGVIGLVGMIALLAAAILALALIMPDWAAALIFGLVFIVVGLLLVRLGVNRFKKVSLVPERTAQTLKEDAEMLKEKTR